MDFQGIFWPWNRQPQAGRIFTTRVLLSCHPQGKWPCRQKQGLHCSGSAKDRDEVLLLLYWWYVFYDALTKGSEIPNSPGSTKSIAMLKDDMRTSRRLWWPRWWMWQVDTLNLCSTLAAASPDWTALLPCQLQQCPHQPSMFGQKFCQVLPPGSWPFLSCAIQSWSCKTMSTSSPMTSTCQPPPPSTWSLVPTWGESLLTWEALAVQFWWPSVDPLCPLILLLCLWLTQFWWG